MSTAVLQAPPAAARTPHGLVRTVLRLHRGALWIWLAFVTATAGFLLWLLGPGAEAAQQKLAVYGYAGLIMSDGPATEYNDLFYYPGTLLTVASFAVALFAGGPLIARELESGTAQLAWTQSVSPARWLATALAVPAAFILLGTTLLTVLYHQLWSTHSDLLVAGIGPRSLYFSLGPATVAAPLLGLALGWWGLSAVLLACALPFVLSGLLGLALLVTRRVSLDSALPLGPFLVAGAFAVLLGTTGW